MSENYYKEAWNYALNEIHNSYKDQGKEEDFILWFKMKYIDDTIDTINVSVPSLFLKTMMDNRGLLKLVQDKIREITDQHDIVINCIVNEENVSESEKNQKKENETKFQKSAKDDKKSIRDLESDKSESHSSDLEKDNFNISESKKEIKKHPLLQEEYTFDTFIPGENSTFAYNASVATAKNPGKQYNPILLYGGSGLGKTHLMQAIGNFIYSNGGEKLKICYVSAESFTNEFTTAIRESKVNSFKNKYRNLDVLLLDDIHFLQKKDATQEELFYTFNALHEKHAQMVFTCDRPIKEIQNMTERLITRLSNGLCIDLLPPNYETRVAILQKKVDLQGKTVSPEIIEYIAKNIETNVRELEAALMKIIGYADLIGTNISLEIAKGLLKDILNSNIIENISLDTIQKVIADNYQISVSDLKSKKRDKKFVIPRQIAIYIARELTEISYTELGDKFGGKDHSTIMTAYKKIQDSIKTDPSLDSKIQIYIREIKNFKNKNS
ncbi:chromosomal replication initiator protein DnaA [Treponema sp. Marseille-Q3903]|uniref:chromosomal replication initiator protein DnaA n=1 Tax=Treponema sp. Marseille-Q3903 TaxID=2766703 RepID=UPI001652999E|nr:chromosomal replication initiator protein DnaA [Treponema sp. Marseille-Q3903]MBC6712633.1 chromosomal replication initiator protein DnaA [Treponema sp. Marseille-Q3903]